MSSASIGFSSSSVRDRLRSNSSVSSACSGFSSVDTVSSFGSSTFSRRRLRPRVGVRLDGVRESPICSDSAASSSSDVPRPEVGGGSSSTVIWVRSRLSGSSSASSSIRSVSASESTVSISLRDERDSEAVARPLAREGVASVVDEDSVTEIWGMVGFSAADCAEFTEEALLSLSARDRCPFDAIVGCNSLVSTGLECDCCSSETLSEMGDNASAVCESMSGKASFDKLVLPFSRVE